MTLPNYLDGASLAPIQYFYCVEDPGNKARNNTSISSDYQGFIYTCSNTQFLTVYIQEEDCTSLDLMRTLRLFKDGKFSDIKRGVVWFGGGGDEGIRHWFPACAASLTMHECPKSTMKAAMKLSMIERSAHQAGFKVTCGISGCQRGFTNFRTFQDHVFALHRHQLDPSNVTPVLNMCPEEKDIYPVYTRPISRFQCVLGTDYI